MMANLVEGPLFRRVIEATPDAVIFADQDGIIRLWNGGAERIFGYSAEEATGQSLDLIIPERLRSRHWEGYHRVMATGTTRYGSELLAVPGIRKDGTQISLEFSVCLLRGESDSIEGIAAILRDVSERWKQQRELQQRLASLEAAVGQQATGSR